MCGDVPEAHQAAAEAVREHLVSLRGGAPFLSPTDAALLLGWLDAGVPVSHILQGLERASVNRRKKRARVPLSLTHAKRYVGRAGKATPIPVNADNSPSGALSALVAALEVQAASDPRESSLLTLSASLAELDPGDPDDPEALSTAAIGRIRVFFDSWWANMSDPTRNEYLSVARHDLADLEAMLDEAAFHAVVEEHARGCLRDAYPHLTATAVWNLVHP